MSLVDLGKRLLEAAKLGETDEVRVLMTNGAPFTTDWLGTSPLHMAAQYGHVTTAEVLLRGGISRDARTKVDKTPLHIASQEGHVAIVELLLNHGAEVDARDMLRMTPLHWAVDRGHYLVVKMLLKCNASVHAYSKFEKTALDIAKDNLYEDLIDLLSKHISSPQTVKVPLILPSNETDSVSSISSKKHTIPSVTISPISVSDMNSVQYTNIKTPNLKSPLLIRCADPIGPEYFSRIQKLAGGSSSLSQASYSSDSDEGESSDPSSTNVLTTLAALAEATAPNASISSSEAMQWLEMHGITMLPTDNSTIVASALEGGQTVSLTEAGKLALRFVKKHQNVYNSSLSSTTSSVTESTQSAAVTSTTATPQRVITIVADQTRIPSIISSPQTPIVVLNNQQNTVSEPSMKKMKFSQVKKNDDKVNNGNTASDEEDSSKLKQELEKMKREAELYKAQLMQKVHEAEQYKRQLEQMKTQPRD